MNRGALSAEQIQEYINKGYVSNIEVENINPASFDISASMERYRIDSIFLPKYGQSIKEIINKLNPIRQEMDQVMEKDVIYAVKIKESINIPNHIYGYCNPKSSSGRHDLHVRIVADGVARYDTISHGYGGELWAIVVARSYPVLIPKDFRISQIRLFNDDTRFTEMMFLDQMHKDSLVYHSDARVYSYDSLKMKDGDGSMLMTIDLSTDIVGYEARGTHKVLNLGAANGSIDPTDFFTPIYRNGDTLHLKKGAFYILSTKEYLRVPPYLASEMVDMDSRTGEFRSHYAGFFDPGWGCDMDGNGKGRPMTLEVRPFEDIMISHQQPIGKVRFEKMSQIPERHYDMMNSNYLKQSGPKLAKQFRL